MKKTLLDINYRYYQGIIVADALDFLHYIEEHSTSGTITDVKVNGVSVVKDNIANITLTDAIIDNTNNWTWNNIYHEYNQYLKVFYRFNSSLVIATEYGTFTAGDLFKIENLNFIFDSTYYHPKESGTSLYNVFDGLWNTNLGSINVSDSDYKISGVVNLEIKYSELFEKIDVWEDNAICVIYKNNEPSEIQRQDTTVPSSTPKWFVKDKLKSNSYQLQTILYQHNISIGYTGGVTGSQTYMTTKLESNDKTAFIYSTLAKWLYQHNFKDTAHIYSACGYNSASTVYVAKSSGGGATTKMILATPLVGFFSSDGATITVKLAGQNSEPLETASLNENEDVLKIPETINLPEISTTKKAKLSDFDGFINDNVIDLTTGEIVQ